MSHQIESGIVLDGEILPGTEWVVRDSRAWWTRGERGTRPRVDAPSLLVGHWTAGRPHEGPDAARHVVRAVKSRKRSDGTPLDVAVHFVVSADGLVTQTCDLAIATVHVGSRDVNRRSIGVEVCHPGTEALALALGGAPVVVRRRVVGRVYRLAAFAESALVAYARLADALSWHVPIPRRVRADTDRMEPRELRRYHGALEHLHVHGTSKIDAGGLLCEALAGFGWEPV